MHRRIVLGALAVTITLLAAGCAAQPSVPSSPSPSVNPTTGESALVGRWEQPGSSVFLELRADGSVSGNDGCNTISGSWRPTGADAATFSPLATTLMACPGVDTWLNQADRVVLAGGALNVNNASGAVIGRLTARR